MLSYITNYPITAALLALLFVAIVAVFGSKRIDKRDKNYKDTVSAMDQARRMGDTPRDDLIDEFNGHVLAMAQIEAVRPRDYHEDTEWQALNERAMSIASQIEGRITRLV